MATRIGINGFGRIGRMFVRALHKDPRKDLDLVAVNDLTSPATLAYLLKYDSVHGRFPGHSAAVEGGIAIDGKKVLVLSERDPAKLPWKSLGIDVVLE